MSCRLEHLVISKRKLRIYYLLLLMLGATLIVSLVLYALRKNINLFYTPSELYVAKEIPRNQIRIGGFVLTGSIKNIAKDNDLTVRFVVTDFKKEIVVEYSGVLPDLFREGQGVVALGRMEDTNVFKAQQILAKHDEKYQPPELAGISL